MKTDIDTDAYAAGFRRFALALTIGITALPLLSLIGWLKGSLVLASFGAQLIPMAPSTAICFLLTALALGMRFRAPRSSLLSAAGSLAAGLVCLYGLLTVIAALTGLAGPDTFFSPDMGSVSGKRAGIMAGSTAALFLLSGVSILSMGQGLYGGKHSGPRSVLAGLAGAVVLLAGLIYSTGYAFAAPLSYGGTAVPMALPTAVTFMLVGAVLMLSADLRDISQGLGIRQIKDMQIGTQLRLGLAAILLSVSFLGAMAWFQTERLGQETAGLYKHSVLVRRAVGELKSEVLSMDIDMKNLLMSVNDMERQAAMEEMDASAARITQQLAILSGIYPGARSDIDRVGEDFARWQAARAETISLARAGKTAEAVKRTTASGPNGIRRIKVLAHIQEISDSAMKKSDEFYAAAQSGTNVLQLQLVTALGAVLLLAAVVGYFLLKNIREPLAELTEAAERYRRGEPGARSRYVSGNEFGELSGSFNAMAEAVQSEARSRESAAEISGALIKEEELRGVCLEALKGLLEHTGSQAGAVYLLNDAKTEFGLFESIGLGSAGRASFSAAGREGEFGAALAARRITRITGIPEDTRFSFPTVSGEFRPREIITIPVLSGQEVVALVSLACLRAYTPAEVRLVNDTWGILSARLNGALALRQIKLDSKRLEDQNRELDAQKRELTAQKDEMSEYNIELELQKKQLGEASRLKSAFLSNMSHELRTPLNSVIALSGVLGRRLAKTIPDEEYGYLEVIERNGKHLLELINDILDLSRIEAGREDISIRTFSVAELAGEVLAVLGPVAREKNITLVSSVDGGLPPIRSDFNRCRHILQNLVGNAVKFTGEGKVEISAAQADGAMEIKVSDTGIGIAADKLHFIFDEFRQAEESTTKTYGGSGLGLAIAKKYANLLQGSISVQSAPGKGSTFTLRLPLAIDLAQPAAEYPAAAHGRPQALPGGKGKTILVVEDSEPAVIQLKDILGEQGYTVRAARNGREALAQIEEVVPDAMILDLMMPEVDGFEVLRSVRGAERTSALPVIILTAKHVSREELSFLKSNHIHQLIQKGDINRADLLAAVGKMVTPQPAPKRASAPPAPARPDGKPLILVVEDNPDSRLAVKAVLEKTHDIIEAADGREGVEQARARLPDLILMDISLPVMDGIAALATIRNEETLRHIPVIALTARAMKGDREQILANGFDGYVTKPIDSELLERTIRETLHDRA